MFPTSTTTERNHVVKIVFLFTLHLWNNQRIKQSSFYSDNRLDLQPIYRAFTSALCQYILCLKIKKQQYFANLHFLFNISPCVNLTLTLHPSIYLAYDAATPKPRVNIVPSVLCISIDLTENGIESNVMMQLALWIPPVVGMCVSESKKSLMVTWSESLWFFLSKIRSVANVVRYSYDRFCVGKRMI